MHTEKSESRVNSLYTHHRLPLPPLLRTPRCFISAFPPQRCLWEPPDSASDLSGLTSHCTRLESRVKWLHGLVPGEHSANSDVPQRMACPPSADGLGARGAPAGRVRPFRPYARIRSSTQPRRAELTQLVECQLPKLDVAGSIPVLRSSFFRLSLPVALCRPLLRSEYPRGYNPANGGVGHGCAEQPDQGPRADN